jgi:hypothetical protein
MRLAIDIVGWAHPKLSSVESAHVTKLFVAAVTAWLLVRFTWRSVAIWAVGTFNRGSDC